jgi:multidrug transporter EmrE-like cation transporter
MRTALLLACYCVSVTAANVLLNLSAHAGGLWPFLAFQAAGNLAGLAGILVYTGLMRRMPLHVAFPLSRGAGVLGVQLVGSVMVFRETFTLREAVGAAVVAAGILLVGFGTPGAQIQGKAPDLLDGGA